jgi:hypothetical protein
LKPASISSRSARSRHKKPKTLLGIETMRADYGRYPVLMPKSLIATKNLKPY